MSAHQGLPPTGVYGSGMDQYVRDEAEVGPRAAAALDEAGYDPLAFVHDHHYAEHIKAQVERDGLVRQALEEAADGRAERAAGGGCHDCGQAAARYCGEHQGDLDTAARYREAAAELEAG